MKKLIILSYAFILIFNFSFAQESWGDFWTDPKWILEAVKDEWQSQWGIQDTELDETYWDWVTWVLENVRDQGLWPYINWAVFIWLSIAVILIIYNWILLIATSMNDSTIGKVKNRLIYLVLWVVLLTWFYFVIAIITSVLQNIL